MHADDQTARNEVGERLKVELARRGLTVESLAPLVGVSRATAFNWAGGVRMPDAVALGRCHAKAGIDVQFVVTGERVSPSQVSQVQADLLRAFEALPSTLRRVVDDVLLLATLAHAARVDYPYKAPATQPGAAITAGHHKPAALQLHDERGSYGDKPRT